MCYNPSINTFIEKRIRMVVSMLSYDDALNMNYYKKTHYTGWMEGMRFLIRKETVEEEDIFHAFAWPGLYIFDLTPDEKKQDATFPFTEDGRRLAVDWINQTFEENISLWPKRKIPSDY